MFGALLDFLLYASIYESFFWLINKVKELYHKIVGFVSKWLQNESLLTNLIFYLSLLTIALTSFSSDLFQNTIENQFRWLNSVRAEDNYRDKYNTAKILDPFFKSNILIAEDKSGDSQVAYWSYLKFIEKPFDSEEEAKKEMALVNNFDDLRAKVQQREIDNALQKRASTSIYISQGRTWSKRLTKALLLTQIIVVGLAIRLESLRLKKRKNKYK